LCAFPPNPRLVEVSVDGVEQEVVAIFKQVAGTAAPVTLNSELLADLGFDSLRVLEMVGDIEDRFSIAVPLNALTHIKTVGQVAAEVGRLVAQREARR
jgi:acyl carrier protein